MFENIKGIYNEYMLKKNILKEFIREHEKYLPKFSPEGQPLNWKISIYKDGEYNILTGEQSGNYKISVIQKCPCNGVMSDTKVYGYDATTKNIKKIRGARWQ